MSDAQEAINDLGAAVDAAKAGGGTYGTSTDVNQGADKIAERG
jgi:hypothetical protein